MSESNNITDDKLEVHNIGHYTFKQTGNSTKENSMGMREMQSRAFAKRNSQYLLIQAPPASGKSRALMFLALDKVEHQGLKKVFIAVPQIAIGSSFSDTNLSAQGFFSDWKLDVQYNLTLPGGEAQKVDKAIDFLKDPNAKYLLCSHATLVYFFNKIKDKHLFDHSLIAIDEFHHVSEDAENRLGNVIHSLMTESSAHIIAMTGSYFRGDCVPVMSPEDERKFDRVTYTYYEQLNGYKYLKSLGINYAFYTGKWVNAVRKLIDLKKKTIIHIPNVNSRESTGDKHNEVGLIFDMLGKVIKRDDSTGIYTFKTNDGSFIQVADLVSSYDGMQGKTLSALRNENVLKNLNFIIALGMAKEGFDWPQCEYALTVGYRASLTEVVQIIGRATRDCPGKLHAQFTNLLAMPNALLTDVTDAVNSLLKAITLSLLMEQVLAPNVHFRKRETGPYEPSKGASNNEGASLEGNYGNVSQKSDDNSINITIDDEKVSQAALDVVNQESADITEKLLNSSSAVKSALANGGEGVTKTIAVEEVSDIIRQGHPELTDHEVEVISQAIVTQILLKILSHGTEENSSSNQNSEQSKGFPSIEVDEDNTFVKFGDKLINVDNIDFSLIESINPFAGAYQFVSKALGPELLKQLQEQIGASREKMTMQKAMELWPYINSFANENKREPNLSSSNDFERRLAVALAYLREQKRKDNSNKIAEE